MFKDEETFLAYVAGVMDGDGSFSIIRKVDDPNRSPLYYPVIQLANACKELVEIFHKRIGGSLFIRKERILKDVLEDRHHFNGK